MAETTTCDDCGALIGDTVKHSRWHTEQVLFRRAVARAEAANAWGGADAPTMAQKVEEMTRPGQRVV